MATFEPFVVEGTPDGALEGELSLSLKGVLPCAGSPEKARFEGEIRRLLDPGSAEETLHWGRNYLFVARPSRGGAAPLVVKQFRNQGLKARLRRRLGGSKAERSWRAAKAFGDAGLATAPPALWAESIAPEGPSWFVTEHLGEVLEARYLLRARNAGRAAEDFPGLDVEAFLDDLGAYLRAMHGAGIWHRDLSIGNVLLGEAGGDGRRQLFVIDLNRARLGRPLSVSECTRDLCRLAIFRPEDQERFLRAYWDAEDAGAYRRWLYHLYHRGFLFKVEGKKRLRGALKGLFGRGLKDLGPRRAHGHIPQAPRGASPRDKIVWDALSDQPHQHAGRWEKLRVRLGDLGGHAATTATVTAALPRIHQRFRKLQRQLYQLPSEGRGRRGESDGALPFGQPGLCLRPLPEDPGALLAAVNDLGAKKLLLRLHPWEDDHGAEEELARELARRGYELSFALPQNRDLVRDPARWRAAIHELGARFGPYGRSFQIGQAINRSKWGVWSYGEYLELAAAAAEILRAEVPEVEILGPSVIDFEYHATAAVLNHRACPAFDVASALLYVDRRGAPENPQAGLDTVGKVALLKAIAETARPGVRPPGRCWITEFNWPLREGPHSPAGRDVAVDEESQANFLVRYLLLALGTGLVERAYWWQLVAKGYGLIDPFSGADGTGSAWRRRPAFRAFAALLDRLGGSTFLGPVAGLGPARLYRFGGPEGRPWLVGWSVEGPTTVNLEAALGEPVTVTIALDRDGREIPVPGGPQISLSAAPSYLLL